MAEQADSAARCFTVRAATGTGLREFSACADETLLAAAQRAGLSPPYSCLSGRCASCRARLLSGQIHYPDGPPPGLDPRSIEADALLLCQAHAASDLSLAVEDVPGVAGLSKRVLPMRVAELDIVAEDVARIRLRPPRGQRIDYLPGQYLDVLLADGRRRAFSIANAPRADGTIDLHVRRVPAGDFTEWVFSGLKPDALLRVEGPLGTFVLREDSPRPLLFMAGGTGFAPIRAMLEHLIEQRCTRPLTLYWGARSPADLYDAALLERWSRQHAGLRYLPVVERAEASGLRQGRVHQALLEDHPRLDRYDVYMSGPPAMIDAAREAFTAAGLPPAQLHYDSFDYAPEVLAAIARRNREHALARAG